MINQKNPDDYSYTESYDTENSCYPANSIIPISIDDNYNYKCCDGSKELDPKSDDLGVKGYCIPN
ncbi:MAG: hypothetical protein Q9M91_08400 [Candidatus Dojkabacteria bacterium]|nr:hypothetical protein [Candidatus Dojkabacteria bacterium]